MTYVVISAYVLGASFGAELLSLPGPLHDLGIKAMVWSTSEVQIAEKTKGHYTPKKPMVHWR